MGGLDRESEHTKYALSELSNILLWQKGWTLHERPCGGVAIFLRRVTRRSSSQTPSFYKIFFSKYVGSKQPNNIQVDEHRKVEAIGVNRWSLLKQFLSDGNSVNQYYGLSKDLDVDEVAWAEKGLERWLVHYRYKKLMPYLLAHWVYVSHSCFLGMS